MESIVPLPLAQGEPEPPGYSGKQMYILASYRYHQTPTGEAKMHIKTILNRIEPHNGFVYELATYCEKLKRIEIRIRPRSGSKALCSICRRKAPLYDRLALRLFQ